MGEVLIFSPLVTDVLLGSFLVDADNSNEILSGSEAFLFERELLPREGVMYHHGALALKESHDVGKGVLGRVESLWKWKNPPRNHTCQQTEIATRCRWRIASSSL